MLANGYVSLCLRSRCPFRGTVQYALLPEVQKRGSGAGQ